MLTGLNHLTLSVSDLERSWRFYVDLLGAQPKARWAQGAYLQIGDLWLCLSLDVKASLRTTDYTHYAFSSNDFAGDVNQLRVAGIVEWKTNHSEGDSIYFLDPDGHRLELHDGDLTSRLTACRAHPYQDMTIYPNKA